MNREGMFQTRLEWTTHCSKRKSCTGSCTSRKSSYLSPVRHDLSLHCLDTNYIYGKISHKHLSLQEQINDTQAEISFPRNEFAKTAKTNIYFHACSSYTSGFSVEKRKREREREKKIQGVGVHEEDGTWMRPPRRAKHSKRWFPKERETPRRSCLVSIETGAPVA